MQQTNADRVLINLLVLRGQALAQQEEKQQQRRPERAPGARP